MKKESESQISEKREKEKQLMKTMVTIYCKGHKHSSGNELCPSCMELLSYSYNKINRCPFMETKTFCNNCHVHCYQKEQREKVKEIMRYSGPRMLYHHPIVAIKHAYYTIKQKREVKANKK